MKQYVYLLFILLILLIISQTFVNHTVIKNKKEKVSEVKENVRVIENISPLDSNFRDFKFLKSTLKNKDMVLLGEQTHHDGATFLAKSRLVKFLHKELGFNAIIFEAGLFDLELLWHELQSDSSHGLDIFSRGLWGFWYKNKENTVLLNYILENINTENEIEIAGLDVQFSGQVNNYRRDSVLSAYLRTKPAIDSSFFPSFYSIKEQYQKFANKWMANTLTKSKRDSILKNIQGISKILKKDKEKKSKDSLFLRFFKNIGSLYNYSWNYKLGSNKRFHIRDSAMADNFFWLKENRFKNQKVIVWTSNLHASYDNNRYTDNLFKFTTMGEHIKKKYGDRCYAINFTSYYSRKSDENDPSVFYNNKTIEYLMHEIGKPYLYLDFNEVSPDSFLSDEIVMNCNQRISLKAKWSKITDGIFFIDNMTGLNPRKN